MWLGPEGTEAVFDELAHLSLPFTQAIPEPSQWFDRVEEATPPSSTRAWAGSVSRAAKRARALRIGPTPADGQPLFDHI